MVTFAFMSFYVRVSVVTDIVFWYIKSFTHEERLRESTLYKFYCCLLMASCTSVITIKSVGNVKNNSADTSTMYVSRM